MAPTTKLFRRLALTSYLGLLGWVVIWHFFLSGGISYSPLFVLLVYVLPLLLPLKGVLIGKPYTHAWANFILMFYLLHGLTAVYAVDGEWLYATLEILLAFTAFIGCSFYARMRGRELGLGLKKLSAEKSD